MRCRARIEREGFPNRYPIWFRNPFRIPIRRPYFLRHPPAAPAISFFLSSPSSSCHWHPVTRRRERRARRRQRGTSVSCVFPTSGPAADSPKKFLGSIRPRAHASNTNTVPVRRAPVLLSSGEHRASVTWNLRNSNIPSREKKRKREGGGREGKEENEWKVVEGRKSHLFRAFGWICLKHLKQVVANGYNTAREIQQCVNSKDFKRDRNAK